MSTYINRVWYTITTRADLADMAVARYRTNGMIAGKVDLHWGFRPYHVYVAGGIWMEDDDHADEQIQDHDFMSNFNVPNDLDFIDLTFDEKRFLCNWIRRTYTSYIGHRWHGPRDIPPGDIWKKIGEYVDNPDNYTWSFMSKNVFYVDQF